MKQFQAKPIIHISTHGGEDGIQLTGQREGGKCIPWSELGKMLMPINRQFDGIWLCMSCCGGAHAKKMAEVLRTEKVPMAWVIGPRENLSYSEGALAFAVFYHLLLQGAERDQLIKAMNATTGNEGFIIYHAPDVQQQYLQDMRHKQVREWLRSHHAGSVIPMTGRRRRSILFD